MTQHTNFRDMCLLLMNKKQYKNKSEMARAFKIDPQLLNRYMNHGVEPSYSNVLKYMDNAGLSLYWIPTLK